MGSANFDRVHSHICELGVINSSQRVLAGFIRDISALLHISNLPRDCNGQLLLKVEAEGRAILCVSTVHISGMSHSQHPMCRCNSHVATQNPFGKLGKYPRQIAMCMCFGRFEECLVAEQYNDLWTDDRHTSLLLTDPNDRRLTDKAMW